jgi:PAS domain-containing protein
MSRFEELTKAADDRMRRFQRAMGIHRPKFPAPRETNSDLEERRRAQDTLRNLRELVDSIPGLVCTISSTGELELFNRQILEYFGKTPEELRDWANSDAVHPDDRSRVIGGRIRADNDSALGGARFSFELPAHGAGGSPATGK